MVGVHSKEENSICTTDCVLLATSPHKVNRSSVLAPVEMVNGSEIFLLTASLSIKTQLNLLHRVLNWQRDNLKNQIPFSRIIFFGTLS